MVKNFKTIASAFSTFLKRREAATNIAESPLNAVRQSPSSDHLRPAALECDRLGIRFAVAQREGATLALPALAGWSIHRLLEKDGRLGLVLLGVPGCPRRTGGRNASGLEIAQDATPYDLTLALAEQGVRAIAEATW